MRRDEKETILSSASTRTLRGHTITGPSITTLYSYRSRTLQQTIRDYNRTMNVPAQDFSLSCLNSGSKTCNILLLIMITMKMHGE